MTSRELTRMGELEDMVLQMGTVQGRRFVYRLMLLSGFLAPPSPYDASYLAYDYGRRSIGQQIFYDIMAAAPKKFTAMMMEAREEETRITEIAQQQGDHHE